MLRFISKLDSVNISPRRLGGPRLIWLVIQEVLSLWNLRAQQMGKESFFTASKRHCSCYVQTMFGVWNSQQIKRIPDGSFAITFCMHMQRPAHLFMYHTRGSRGFHQVAAFWILHFYPFPDIGAPSQLHAVASLCCFPFPCKLPVYFQNGEVAHVDKYIGAYVKVTIGFTICDLNQGRVKCAACKLGMRSCNVLDGGKCKFWHFPQFQSVCHLIRLIASCIYGSLQAYCVDTTCCLQDKLYMRGRQLGSRSKHF